MRRYRIIYNPRVSLYAVQYKGWFGWNQMTTCSACGLYEELLWFSTEKSARQWIADQAKPIEVIEEITI